MGVSKAHLDKLERRAKSAQPNLVPAPQAAANIIDFATNHAFVGIDLYPKQATLLKIATLATELMTPFDYEVIGEWSAGFTLSEDHDGVRYTGASGVPADVLDRIT